MQRPKLLMMRGTAAAGGGGPYPAIGPLQVAALTSFAGSSSTHFGPFGYAKRGGAAHRPPFPARRPPTLPAISRQLFKLPDSLLPAGRYKV